MTMLDAAKKTNGHAEPTRAWEARIEQRLAEFAASGEQRVLALREAMGEFVDTELAPRDEEIATLKKRVADLEHKFERKTAVDQQVDEIATRLEERLAHRDSGKNALTGGDFIQTMGMLTAQERESAREEFKAAVEEAKHAVETMLTLKLDAFEQRIVQRTDQRIIGRDGKDADPEAVARLVGERIEEPLHEFIRAQVDTKLTALEERLKSVPGRLPIAKIWRVESVTYEGEFVCYEGALVASFDTGGDSGSNVIGGGQVGCDYQFAGNLVIGIQGMFDWTDIQSSHLYPPLPSTETLGIKTKWIGTVTGRIGYSFLPQSLLYFKGGGAWARIDYSDTDPFFTPPYVGQASVTRSGWTVGGGFEYAFLPNWSWFVEYDYINLGNQSEPLTYNCGSACGFPNPYTYNISHNISEVLAGINYRFGWFGH